jgi:hypothetical protein
MHGIPPTSVETFDPKEQSIRGESSTPVSFSLGQLLFWSLFWLAVGIILYITMTGEPDLEIKRPEKLLIGVAIISTAVFAHFSILLPFMKPGIGIESASLSAAVFLLIIAIGIISTVLGSYYFDLAYHGRNEWINWTRLLRSISDGYFSFFEPAIRVFAKWHTSTYALVFLITDLIIAFSSCPEATKTEFRRVAVNIDLPMFVGVLSANYLAHHIGDSSEFFLAGAVSLQLFVANIQLLIFKWQDYAADSKEPASSRTSNYQWNLNSVGSRIWRRFGKPISS